MSARDFFSQVPERVWRSWPIRQKVICLILQMGHPNPDDPKDRRVRGTYFGRQEELATKLGTTVGTVKNALRAERQAGNLIVRGTHIGNGYDGFNAYAVVGATDLPSGEAIDLLASRFGLNLLPETREVPGRRAGTDSMPPTVQAGTDSMPPAGTDSMPPAGTDSVPAIGRDHQEEDHQLSDHENGLRTLKHARGGQIGWHHLVAQGADDRGFSLSKGSLIGIARRLKRIELREGLEAAVAFAQAAFDAVDSIPESTGGFLRRKPSNVLNEVINGSEGMYLDYDDPAIRDRREPLDADLWTEARWNDDFELCVPSPGAPDETSPDEPNDDEASATTHATGDGFAFTVEDVALIWEGGIGR